MRFKVNGFNIYQHSSGGWVVISRIKSPTVHALIADAEREALALDPARDKFVPPVWSEEIVSD
jgi:hypothetical protein